MELRKIRSYRQEVMDRLAHLVPKDLSIEFMGFIEHETGSYPLFYLISKREMGLNIKNVLISAGIHGEEPAGVYALLRFLEHDIYHFLGDYRFLIFPCINAFGFEHNRRFNQKGKNINREFKDGSKSCEAKKVMEVLKKRDWKFDLTVDLHETDPNYVGEGFSSENNPKEFYLWEVCSDRKARIGDRVVKEVERSVEVCKWPRIYDDINSGGVIWYPEGCFSKVYAKGTTLEGFLAANYTPQAFTLETPCGWPIEKRIFAHTAALRTILNLKQSA